MAILQFYLSTGKEILIDENKEINRGGEGRLIIPDGLNNKIAKIYHDNIKPLEINKFNEIIKLKNHLFILPEELLFDKKKKIKGFIMQLLEPSFFPLASIFNKNFCIKNNINLNFKKQIAQKLIDAVVFAHKNIITIGDLNQYNIMINQNMELKIIDTDSFGTETFKHSEILLDEIRDYLFNGKVSFQSDYFALSVLIFYMFTFTHPFKGIHKIFKSLAERMVNKIPVFLNDSDLVIPKCYEPISNKILQTQFENLYLNGNRFLISLNQISEDILKSKQILKPQQIIQKNITITTILQNAEILDINFNKTIGYIETNELYLIYNTENKGFVTKIAEISKQKVDKLFIGNKNIIFTKNNILYQFISDTKVERIKNFQTDEIQQICQYENIIMVLENDELYKVYIDEILSNSIKIQRTNVFGNGFIKRETFIQNTGGINRIFYNTGKDISNLKFETNILNIKQTENIFIYQTIENNVVKNKIHKIKGLFVDKLFYEIGYFTDFAFLATEKDEGFIFIPSDNNILVIRTLDFKQISEIECEFVSEHSKLIYTKSGILCFENGNLYLINNK